MNYLLALLLLAGLLSPSEAIADPMDSFTITGDGHTFQFASPATATTSDHPHIITVSEEGLPGTVDGVGGYTFGYTAIVKLNFGDAPVLTLEVNPLPPGEHGSSLYGIPLPPDYDLYGESFARLISDVPNPLAICGISLVDCYDTLTFQFVPGEYSLFGFAPSTSGTFTDYTLDITTEPSTAATPEPSSWVLLLTGVAIGGASLFVRGRSGVRRKGLIVGPHT